jgi:hypothetical protein
MRYDAATFLDSLFRSPTGPEAVSSAPAPVRAATDLEIPRVPPRCFANKDCMGLPDDRPPEAREVCPYSKHKRFWVWADRFGKTYRCAICHPPASPDAVEGWEEFP